MSGISAQHLESYSLAVRLKKRDDRESNLMGSTSDPYRDTVGEQLLEAMQFQLPLRKYQQEILGLVEKKLAAGERRMHLVAPPGAGKTIIGLQIISQLKCNSLILSPNTTIQSQWGQKVDLFLPPDLAPYGTENLIGTHEDKPLKPITMLTYQVLSTPGREIEYLERLAHDSWVAELTGGRSISVGEAELRIVELLQNNPKAHQQELGRHVSRLRRRLTDVLDLKEVLHPNALDLLQALRRQKFGVVIFDECHHLTDYWAAIMHHLVKVLGDPVIIGLTGTPPEGKTANQETRYLSLVGEIDYQVPTPALVKEGGLAPFQDLAFFTEPTEKELQFLEEQHIEFHNLLEELTTALPTSESIAAAIAQTDSNPSEQKPEELLPPLTQWVKEKVFKAVQKDVVRVHPSHDLARKSEVKPPQSGDKAKANGKTAKKNGSAEKALKANTTAIQAASVDTQGKIVITGGWTDLLHNQVELAQALCRYLYKVGIAFPRNIEVSEVLTQAPTIDDWMRVLDDYAAHKLKVSGHPADQKLYERIRAAARKLGYGITEQGLRKQASPVDRVLAFSNSKPQAVAQILDIEHRMLQERLRAVVVTDFERMSVTSVKTLKGVLDEESGGAVACLKTLLASPISEFINPCLVTGSLLLTDNRITDKFVEAAQEYLKKEGHGIKLHAQRDENSPFSHITGSSSSWESKLYVGMATAIFERGITKCLVGTRGLFGEGWDSQSLNTLIDLTTTTSPVSVKQLRGRSIRIQTNDPLGAHKVANNWDVVCVAPQLEKGLNDYYRFARKHDCFFGMCDDGHIERGVGHVHPAFSDLTPIEVFASSEQFNDEMMQRALLRDRVYRQWGVGQPYHNKTIGCVEFTKLRSLALTPPHLRRDLQYKDHAAHLRASLVGVWAECGALGAAASAGLSFVFASMGTLGWCLAALPFIGMLVLAQRRWKSLYGRMRKEICCPNTQDSSLDDIGSAVLSALQKRKFLPLHVRREDIKISRRSDGTYRVFVDEIEPELSNVFMTAFREVMAPITNQPYLIPKYEYFIGSPEPEISDAPELEDQPPELRTQPAPSNLAKLDSQPQQVSPNDQGVNSLDLTFDRKEALFFKAYLAGRAKPRIAAYHAVPSLLARSEKGREAFETAWNKYVSPGFIVATETQPQLIDRYFGVGPSLSQRVLWE
ncbi:MAG TPA: DEAD/DEAH box helicase family protein [Planktothrix sp.]